MKEKILIVDDITENRVLLHELLDYEFDVDIDEAENGIVALELADKKKYDVVLMDVKMPKKDGYEVARELRENQLNKDVIIIFITAHDSIGADSEKAFDAGGIDYITKPIDHNELKRKIQLYLRFIQKENEFISRLLEINKRLEQEVSVRKSVEVQLIKTQENFKNIVGKSKAAILIVDNDGNLKFVNHAGELIFGRKTKDLLGQSFGVISDFELKSEIDIIKSNGEIGTGEITTTKTQWENKPAWLVLINDITEHKKVEEQLKEEKDKAQQSDRLKSNFLSNMSHEIRTPMNAILGFLDFLDLEDDSDKRKEYTDIIRSSGDHLLRLINDIIDISKIEAGQLNIKIEDCSIDKLFLELHEFFVSNEKVLQGNIELNLDIPINQDELIIKTDKSRLNQVLINLLGNAMKFTDSGKIRFGYIEKGEELEFFVEDTGIGITQEHFDEVFERFKQVDNKKSAGNIGTGLGLAISKSLVELLGGRIWLDSEYGVGTTFYFTIPNKIVDEVTIDTESIISQNEISTDSLENKKVLIAEDIELNYSIICALLKKEGVDITWARNGKEAVELCKENNFDIILMDIKMPIMDGLEATRTIRTFNIDIPIIAQTAYAMQNEKEKCFEAGCNGYLSKPLKKDQLIETMYSFFTA